MNRRRIIIAFLTVLIVGLGCIICSDLIFAISSVYQQRQQRQQPTFKGDRLEVAENAARLADPSLKQKLSDWLSSARLAFFHNAPVDPNEHLLAETLTDRGRGVHDLSTKMPKRHKLYVDHNSLTNIGLKDFVIKGDQICGTEKVGILVLVHSAFANQRKRNIQRKTWTKPNLEGVNTRVAFLVGRPPIKGDYTPRIKNGGRHRAQQELVKEADTFQDIVQADFIDTYRNLTTKNIFGNLWISSYCHQAELVVRTDDDTFIDLYAVHHITRDLIGSPAYKMNEFMLCPVNQGGRVHRNKKDKWYVSYQEWSKKDSPGDKWPNFCSGNFVATNPGTAARLVEAARHTKFLSLDDVWVSGYLVSQLNFTHFDLSRDVLQLDPKKLLATKLKQSTHVYHHDYLVGTVSRLEDAQKLHQLAEACYAFKCRNNLYMDYKRRA